MRVPSGTIRDCSAIVGAYRPAFMSCPCVGRLMVTGASVAHLLAVGLWGGIVAVEAVIELADRETRESRDFVARSHCLIDKLLELPAIGLVIVTGVVLAIGQWPPSVLLWAHAVPAACAIAANGYCAWHVFARAGSSDDEAWAAHDRRVRASAVGIPFAIVAVIAGFALAT